MSQTEANEQARRNYALEAFTLVPGKYGWFTIAALTDGATKAASVSK